MVPHILLLAKYVVFYLGGSILKETPERLKREINCINERLIKIMAKNSHYKNDPEYINLRTKRDEAIRKLGRLVRKVEYIEELKYKNRGVRL